MSRRPGSGRRGFTLLEIMVSLAILGIALAVTMQVFSRGLRAADKTRIVSMETYLARGLMEETFLPRLPPEGSESGAFADLPDYAWERTVDLYEDLPELVAPEQTQAQELEQEPPYRIYRITVTVHRIGRPTGGVTLETLRTYAAEEEDGL